MEIQINNPQVKNISLEDYEKFFMEGLKNPDNYHLLFYKKTGEGIIISFSWDNFIIIVNTPYSQILEIYKDQNLDTADVKLSDTKDHPILLKFYSDYLFNRGIPER